MYYKVFSMLLFLTTVSLLSSSCSNAQNKPAEELLEKTEHSLNGLKTVTFKINRTEKPFSSRDTLYRTAICSIYPEPNDKIGMYFITNIKTEEDTLYHRVYNGENFSMLSLYVDGTMKIKNFENVNMKQNNNIEGYFDSSFVLPYIFGANERFTDFKNKSKQKNIKKIVLEEEIYKQTPVYVLSIFFKNHDDNADYVNNGVDKYCIRKSDYLPIAYSSYGEFQGMKEYVFADIEYLDVNSLTSEDFTPYTKVEDANIEAIYKQTKNLFDKHSFPNKNRTAKKKRFQTIVDVKIIDNKLPFNEFVVNNDETIKLSEFTGKVVLLDFWYRSCLPCLKTIPELIKLQEKYKNDLVIIGINDRDEKDDVSDFLNYKNVNYRSTYKNEVNISKSLKINAFPTIIIINKNGEIAETKVGYNDKSTLIETIKKLIKENG